MRNNHNAVRNNGSALAHFVVANASTLSVFSFSVPVTKYERVE
jgi:hypothetical protein